MAVAARIAARCNSKHPTLGLHCNLDKHEGDRHQFKGAVVWWSDDNDDYSASDE
jgi:hypothetical protein